MQKSQTSSRKSKRVAKRQEDEIYWLIHNFPQGVDYNDLYDTSKSKLKSSPKSSEHKGLPLSIKKILDENSADIAVKMPRLLRSGKSISQENLCVSSLSNNASESLIQQDHQDEFVGSSIEKTGPSDTCSTMEINNQSESREFIDRKSENNTSLTLPSKQTSKTTRSESLSKQKMVKVLSNKEEFLSQEERAQKERVEQLKRPKFKSEPSKICTRSGAYYAFSWKSPSCRLKQQSVVSKKDICKNKTVDQSSKIVTRSSSKNQTVVRLNQDFSKTSKNKTGSVKVEDETNDSKPVPKKMNAEQHISDVTENMQQSHPFTDENVPITVSKKSSSPQHNTCKRKRLSLLPQQNQHEEDDFTATWLDALNRNDTPTSDKGAPCSRPDSPDSPISSTFSGTLPISRGGRTASINCKAVISALIKPEPVLARKSLSDSFQNISSSPKDRYAKTECTPDHFFKIKVTSSYKQQVEVVNNGVSAKIHSSPDSLKIHESTVLANVEKVRVTTNGWSWVGAYIWHRSFYRDPDVKTTRLYFGAMERDGVELRVGDSVALQTSEKDNIKPFVGKIIAMWQDNLGEMMVTLCWFYRPSDLENIKSPYGTHELYLSKHTDDNSVATIQNKVHVLSFPEYCRYYAYLAEKRYQFQNKNIVPNTVKWRGPEILLNVSQQDCIYFCRGVYDFRLKRTLKQQLYYTKYL